ncbi:MAG TPA: OmpH family outer membrane protein, partial [Chryseolinea sp.]
THNNRIVCVDSVKLLNNYEGMKRARLEYQQKSTGWQANVDSLTHDLQRQISAYEKERSRLSVKERQLSEELIRTKQKQLADYKQALTTNAQQEDAKMTGNVVSQVNAYLKRYGEAKGYTVILAATEYGNLAFVDSEFDVTEEVLQGLNKEYSGK